MSHGVYHTALAGGRIEDAPELQWVSFPDGVAMQHNIWDPLPREFEECDVWYVEPPFRRGYDEFNERAGTGKQPAWNDFRLHLDTMAIRAGVPVVYVSGREAFRYHPAATDAVPMKLNGNDVWALCYNIRIDWPHETNEQVIRGLADRFKCIGDFACGYGFTGAIARQQGARFVLSDHNAQCIGYVAQRLGERDD